MLAATLLVIPILSEVHMLPLRFDVLIVHPKALNSWEPEAKLCSPLSAHRHVTATQKMLVE